MTKSVMTNIVTKRTTGSQLRQLRLEKGYKLRDVAMRTGIDQAIVSKHEHGHRVPTAEHVDLYAQCYELDRLWLYDHLIADQIAELMAEASDPDFVWEVAEPRIEYLRSSKVMELPVLSDKLHQALERIDLLREQWQAAHPLDEIQLQRMAEYFRTSYTYDSNQIEGNTLSLRETDLVIHKGLTIAGKSMAEHLEAVNHGEAIDYIHQLVESGESVSSRGILDLHNLILRGIAPAHAGVYRKVSVRISGSTHVPPDALEISQHMEKYHTYYRSHKDRLHPVILAAEMHERLVTIHPFIDGNGRTSRLVMNMILLQHGYTITSLKGDHDSRMRYYAALDAIQSDADSSSFYELICEAVESSLCAHLEWI